MSRCMMPCECKYSRAFVSISTYLKQLSHVVSDVDQIEFGVQFPEVCVRKPLEHEAGCPLVGALHDVEHFDDVGVIDRLENVVLSFYFIFADGEEDLDGYSFAGFGVGALEHVGVPPSSYF